MGPRQDLPLASHDARTGSGRDQRARSAPVRFHDLRHGAATMAHAAGVSMKVVSEILGHADEAFTANVYAVVAEETPSRPQCRSPAFSSAGKVGARPGSRAQRRRAAVHLVCSPARGVTCGFSAVDPIAQPRACSGPRNATAGMRLAMHPRRSAGGGSGI
ncbi:tyrosine-type recombinase/integrase [Actinomadura sp. NEAU-AAG7]|nr:tyrosine-type recombinase/integrase [Actinomadura sp. NEAU-AAG7]